MTDDYIVMLCEPVFLNDGLERTRTRAYISLVFYSPVRSSDGPSVTSFATI